MLYTWKDNHTGLVITVSRRIAEIEQPPTKEEAIKVEMDIHDYAEAEWERIIETAPTFTGPKGKGSW